VWPYCRSYFIWLLQYERAHDFLAELGFGDNDAAQALGGNEKHLDICRSARVNERGAAR
jgi:hypothetical protein